MAITKTIEASLLSNDRHYRTAVLFHNHLKNALRPLGDVARLLDEELLAVDLRKAERAAMWYDHGMHADRIPTVTLRDVRGRHHTVFRALHPNERHFMAVEGETYAKYLAENLAVELLKMIQRENAEDPHVLKGVDIRF